MLIVQKLCLSVMGKEPRKVKAAKSLDLQFQTQGNQLTSRRERHLGRENTDTKKSGHLFKSRKSIRQNLDKNGVSGNGILQVEVTLLVYLSFKCFLIYFTGNGQIKTLNFKINLTYYNKTVSNTQIIFVHPSIIQYFELQENSKVPKIRWIFSPNPKVIA